MTRTPRNKERAVQPCTIEDFSPASEARWFARLFEIGVVTKDEAKSDILMTDAQRDYLCIEGMVEEELAFELQALRAETWKRFSRMVA